ncbi:MAG: acetate--CoA ligase family protein [Actinobacteria bacterium]|nr:MAG: acetate--CoA ligase family protein [Actinomycetota bacterium]
MNRTAETDLRYFFHPRTIAVIGATDDKRKPGYALLMKVRARAERDGATVYGVNPRLTDIDGIACYPSVADVPGEIDVAVIMIGDAEQGLRDVVAKGARFAIIFTAGFREVGAEGAKREEELAKIARDGGVRLFGPNTNVNAFEMFPETDGKKLALVTQSGHQGRPIAQGIELGIGVKYWAPTGNEADLEFADFVEYFVDIDDVAVVVAYIEGFKSIPRLRAAAEKAARAGKPIVLVKIGRTEAGQRMAMAHTGHLTGSDAATNAFFRQYGMVRVDDLDELLETAALFTRLPRPVGEGLCVYAISGGTGAHMADLCAWGGLELPTLTEESQQKLREAIPDYLTVSNPVDNGAQVVRKGGLNRRCIEICLDDPNVDILVCPITGILPSMSQIVAGDIVDAYKSAKKPVVVIWGSPVTDEEGYRILLEGGVPMFRSFRSFVVGLRRYLDYWRFLSRFEERPVAAERIPGGFETMLAGSGPLSEYDSATLATQYGVPFPMSALCETSEQAVEAAARLGESVVMKACGDGILHKTDAGLVRVGVPQEQIAETFKELDEAGRAHAGDAGYDGVLVQQLAPEGEEVIVGFSNDPQYGPVVLFGLGGVFVEVLKDVALRVAPLTLADAEEMIREVKGFPLLDGARGRPKGDVDALADLILNVSRMATELRGRIAEFDLNPVRVRPAGQGVVALDALIVRRDA